jgi:hypothetical protein
MKGAEGMPAEADQLAAGLYSALAKELAARGVEVLPNPITAATTDEARYAVADLQAKYDNVRAQLRKKPIRVDQGHLTLGDGVAAFKPGSGADAFVMVRGFAVKATSARQAALLIGFGAASGFAGDIAFVDARTGDVLAWTRITRNADVSQDADQRLARSARDALRDIPFPAGKGE